MAEEYNYDEYNRFCGEQARLEDESYYYEQRISELESNLEQLNPRYSSRRKGKY